MERIKSLPDERVSEATDFIELDPTDYCSCNRTSEVVEIPRGLRRV